MTTLEFDPDAHDMPSVAVVEAVATELQLQSNELECRLQDVINPKALNRLFAPTLDGTPRAYGDAIVQFEFCGCDVAIFGDGRLDAALMHTERRP